MSISLLGSAIRFPFVPAASRNDAILAAIPMHIVETSHLMKFIVSYIAMPEVMLPPGLLIYRLLSFSGSCEEYDTVVEQSGIDVKRTLAAVRLFNYHWDK